MEQQRKRAKDLLRALRSGAPEALARMRASHPRLAAAATPAAVQAAARLADAQLVIAREYGFASWPRLRAHIATLAQEAVDPAQPFRTELAYYRDRAAGLVSVHGTGERNALRLIRRLHPVFAAADEGSIRDAAFTQADGELVLAREHGFADWPAFAAHIEAVAQRAVAAPFRDAFVAIESADLPGLAALLEATPALVNARGTNGNRLLTLAVAMGRTEMVAYLLDRGADPDLPNDKSWTGLHAAAYAGPESDADAWLPILDLLLAAGASVEMEAYGDGGTPLAVALFWGHVRLAERLADEAVTPANLRVAAGLGRPELVAACFAADGSLSAAAGAHREFHRPHSGFPAWVPRDDAQEVLDEALGWAARNGRVTAMATLVARGARLDSEPYNGTALHWATARDKLDAAAWLLDQGADVNRVAAFGGMPGITPLHLAARLGREAAARLLLDRGADRQATDPQHRATPAEWAEFFRHTAISAMCRA
jgi:ankyrin repeat protein